MIKVIADIEESKTKVLSRKRISSELGVLDLMGALNDDIKQAVTKTYFYGKDLKFSVSLFDMEKSEPVALFLGKEFTRIRTASVTFSFLRFINFHAKEALIVGYGYQAYGQAMALSSLGIKRIDVAGRDPIKGGKFSEAIGNNLNVESSYINFGDFRNYKLIVTATSSPTPILKREQINDGVIIAIGSYKREMSEIEPRLMCEAESVIVDSKDQAVTESGEIAGLLDSGCRSMEEVQSLSELFYGRNMRKYSEGSIIIFKSVGMAAEDLATASSIYSRIEESGKHS